MSKKEYLRFFRSQTFSAFICNPINHTKFRRNIQKCLCTINELYTQHRFFITKEDMHHFISNSPFRIVANAKKLLSNKSRSTSSVPLPRWARRLLGNKRVAPVGTEPENTGSACWVKLMGASSGFGLSLDSYFFRQ